MPDHTVQEAAIDDNQRQAYFSSEVGYIGCGPVDRPHRTTYWTDKALQRTCAERRAQPSRASAHVYFK
eukprot:scaffold23927_cov41-Prasinocladus_malaysianus.AAC.3